MKRVSMGSFAAASRMASFATSCVTPPISKRTRPGLMTATQPSGLPLPPPMRTSAGFLVTGLSGKIRIQIWPPRLTWRVIARRAASIWRLVIQQGSIAWRPNWPNEISAPRVAMPDIRPRCILRYLTRLGRSIGRLLLRSSGLSRLGGRLRLRLDLLGPGRALAGRGLLDGRLSRSGGLYRGGGIRRGGALHGRGPGPHRAQDRLLHGAPVADPALDLAGDVLGHQLGVHLGLLDLLDRDPDPVLEPLLEVLPQLVDRGAALADHDARLGGVDRHSHLRVGGTLGLDLGDSGVAQAAEDDAAHLEVLVEELRVVLVLGEPVRLPGAVDAQPEPVRMNLVTH